MKELFIIRSNEQNVYKNLALESCMLDFANNKPSFFLFLWENDSTVVIGKHQNPYSELDMQYAQENNVKIARRITGGGAVYHTKGNLNFSLILPKNNYSKNDSGNIIMSAINKVGIKAEISGRNDITINNKKFSGNAYYIARNTFLHHGTILINLPIEEAHSVLTPNKYKFKKNSVNSVESRIINLKEINEDLDIEIIKEKIEEATIDYFTNEKMKICRTFEPNETKLQQYYEKYSSNAWIYSKFKKFDVKIKKNFPWGSVEIGKDENNNIKIATDSINSQLIDNILNKNINPIFKTEEEEIIYKNISNLIKNIV